MGVPRLKAETWGNPPPGQDWPSAVSLDRSEEALGPRKLAVIATLGLVLLRYGLLHEVLTFYTQKNFYLLYLVGTPALLGWLLSGGIWRTFASRPIRWWTLFVVWLFLSVPFSTWQAESASYALTYLRTVLPPMLVLAGVPMTWKEVRMVLYTIAISGIVNVSAGWMFGNSEAYGDRAGLEFGIVGNPNDFAGHLVLVLPLVLFLIIRPPAMPGLGAILRIAGIGALALGLYLVVASGSRGSLLAVVATLFYVFVRATTKVRLAMMGAVPLLVAGLVMLLPARTISRLTSFSTSNSGVGLAPEEVQSAENRRFLLEESLRLSLTRPIFGVGPGEFPNYEGRLKSEDGRRIAWINPHNSYTQISSETGIPGLIFYVGGVLSTFLLLQKTWKRVRYRPELREISVAIFLVSTSLVGFSTAIFFLNFGYFFYLPAFAGLAACMAAAVDRELQVRVAPVALTMPLGVPATVPPPRAASAPAPTPARRNPVRFGRMR